MVSTVENREAPAIRSISWGLVCVVWQVIRWPAFALLIVLEPILRVGLSTFALLGTLCAFLLRFEAHRPQFPFWGMLGVSLSCVGLLALYYALIRLLSGR